MLKDILNKSSIFLSFSWVFFFFHFKGVVQKPTIIPSVLHRVFSGLDGSSQTPPGLSKVCPLTDLPLFSKWLMTVSMPQSGCQLPSSSLPPPYSVSLLNKPIRFHHYHHCNCSDNCTVPSSLKWCWWYTSAALLPVSHIRLPLVIVFYNLYISHFLIKQILSRRDCCHGLWHILLGRLAYCLTQSVWIWVGTEQNGFGWWYSC